MEMVWPPCFYKAFLKNKKRSGTSLPTSFSTWFLKKNISVVIFSYLTKFQCLVAFNSWDIGQYVYCNCLLTLPAPTPDKQKKLTQIFIFTLLCEALKGFLKAFNVCLMKILKRTVTKKVVMCFYYLGEGNF